MELTRFDINGSAAAMKTFLDACVTAGLFDSVTLTDDTDLAIKDADGNTLCTFEFGGASADQVCVVTVYLDANTTTLPSEIYWTGTVITSAYLCDNGAFIEFYRSAYNSRFPIIMAKTNHGKLAFLYSTQTQDATVGASILNYTAIRCVTWGDGATGGTKTDDGTVGNQTVLCRIPTQAKQLDISYLTDCYRISHAPVFAYRVKQIMINDTVYLTNGYYALKIGGAGA